MSTTDGVIHLFTSIGSKFKSTFGVDKDEYSTGGLVGLYFTFFVIFMLPLIYLGVMQFVMKKNVMEKLMTAMKGDKEGMMYAGLLIVALIGLIGLIWVGVKTKKKDGFSAKSSEKKPKKKFGVDHSADPQGEM